jgi:four helix bundle protein
VSQTSFEKLKVYQLSERLADSIWDIVLHWPFLAKDTVGKQIIRSADSIGANIAEGVGRQTYQDSRRLVRVARGSLYETKHWLRRAFKRQLLNQKCINELKSILDELLPRLNAYLRSLPTWSTSKAENKTTNN